jgi:hypothetical protein
MTLLRHLPVTSVLSTLFSDTLSLCSAPSFTPIQGYDSFGVGQKNDDWLRAGVTTLARYFRFFSEIKAEREIIVEISGYNEEIEGYGVHLYGTWLYFVVFYRGGCVYCISSEADGAVCNYLWREKPTGNVGSRFAASRKRWNQILA